MEETFAEEGLKFGSQGLIDRKFSPTNQGPFYKTKS